MARQLFEELTPIHGLPEKLKGLLMAASLLHDVGRYVNIAASHKHTLYILRNTDFPFFNDRERLMVACNSRYHRKSTPRDDHDGWMQLDSSEKKIVEKLASILRIADALDAPHDQGVKWLKCQWGPNKVQIHAELKNGNELDQNTIQDKARMFENIFKMTVTVSTVDAIKGMAKNPVLVEPARAK